MTHFRFRYKVLGGHTHVRVFSGPTQDATHGKCGDLMMRNDEFEEFRKLFNPDFPRLFDMDAEFVEESGA